MLTFMKEGAIRYERPVTLHRFRKSDLPCVIR